MTTLDDEFDLDVRITVVRERTPIGDLVGRGGLEEPLGRTGVDTVAPAQTCPDDTCGMDCITMTCPEETCGCNTVETCDQQLEDCGGGFTMGQYCEDASGGEDTCHGCSPAGTDVCGDPPDV